MSRTRRGLFLVTRELLMASALLETPSLSRHSFPHIKISQRQRLCSEDDFIILKLLSVPNSILSYALPIPSPLLLLKSYKGERVVEVYKMLTATVLDFCDFGTTTWRIPFFKTAWTPSWSILCENEKLRANEPTLRSETQSLVLGFGAGAGVSACGSGAAAVVVAGVGRGVSASSYSSSTVAVWDFSDAVSVSSASTSGSGVPAAAAAAAGPRTRCVLPLTTMVCASVKTISRSFCSMPGSSPYNS
jgi:hypothetical protein